MMDLTNANKTKCECQFDNHDWSPTSFHFQLMYVINPTKAYESVEARTCTCNKPAKRTLKTCHKLSDFTLFTSQPPDINKQNQKKKHLLSTEQYTIKRDTELPKIMHTFSCKQTHIRT